VILKRLLPVGGAGLLAMLLVGFALLPVDKGIAGRKTGEQLSRDLTNSGSSNSYTKRSSSALALSVDGNVLLAANPDSDSVSIVNLEGGMNVKEVAVGDDPRTVAISADGSRAYSANRAGNSISVIDVEKGLSVAEVTVGARPYGIVLSPDGQTLYIALQGDDQLVLLDTSSLQILARWPTADRPSGLALTEDGQTLLISHLLLSQVTVLDLPLYNVFLPVLYGSGAGGLISLHEPPIREDGDVSQSSNIFLWPDSNLVQSIVIGPVGSRAYIPHTLSNSANRSLTLDTTMAPVVSVLDLAAREHLVGEQFNLELLDPPAVGLPFDAAIKPDGSEMWVLNAASNDITVIDLESGTRLAHVEVGDNPRGIIINPGGDKVYVNNTLSSTLSVIDASTYTTTVTIPITTLPLESALLLGKRLFNSSDDPRMGVDQWMSCNSCHFDGENDGRTWQLGFAGPRNTTSLFGLSDTFPLRWSGEWDEAADAEFAIRMDSFGTGLVEGDLRCSLNPPDCTNQLPHAGLSADLDALAAYISSLPITLSPGHSAGQPLSDIEQRGKEHFNDPDTGCVVCHPAPTYTDNLSHVVGTATADERIGPAFNTPSLRGLYDSPPYFHDGRALTLYEAVTFSGGNGAHDISDNLNQAEIAELITFLLALPYQE